MRRISRSWAGLSRGCLPRSLPCWRAMAMPSRVRWRIRLASNSAMTARICRNIRANGSSQSYVDPPSANRTPRRLGPGRAEPVQLGDGQGVALPDGGQGLVEAGPGAAGAGEPLVEVDPVRGDAEGGQAL